MSDVYLTMSDGAGRGHIVVASRTACFGLKLIVAHNRIQYFCHGEYFWVIIRGFWTIMRHINSHSHQHFPLHLRCVYGETKCKIHRTGCRTTDVWQFEYNVQMLHMEKTINNTFITGFNDLKTMVLSEADVLEANSAPAPSPTSARNSTSNTGGGSVVDAMVRATRDVQYWADKALEAVSGLSNDVEAIKWKANRVSFNVLHDYGNQYGFYRLAAYFSNWSFKPFLYFYI